MLSCTYASPIGQLTLSAKAGRLLKIAFQADHAPSYAESFPSQPDEPVLDQARHELDEYFQGYRRRFDVPIAMMGSPFQFKVWSMLLRVPFGKTLSYRDLATVIGQREATRAVACANAANPLPIIVPCHRVIASDGTLAGYAGGIDIKRTLLDHEGANAGLFVSAVG